MSLPIFKDICADSIFSKIYEKYAQSLTDFLFYKYGEQYNPGDKAQDAFIKLWENCHKVSSDKAKSFLFTTANNMLLNEIKHQKVVLNYKKQVIDASENENPEFLMRQQQYYEQYKKALESLSEEQRTAFLLNKTEGNTHQQIADKLGVTKKVVEYRIYSAFKILKEKLEGFKT